MTDDYNPDSGVDAFRGLLYGIVASAAISGAIFWLLYLVYWLVIHA